MIEPIDLLVSLLAIAGQWCMATRRRIGWLWFLATNVLLIAIACDLQRWGLIPGYLVLSAINVYGLAKWRGPLDSHPPSAFSTAGLKETQ
jgi:nicotinamide riboside transporter PnuC